MYRKSHREMIRTVVLIFALLISTLSSEAQFRNGYPYGGRNNSIVPRADIEPEPQRALTAEEIVEEQMPAITEAAQLNEFEQAVVYAILTKYVQQSIELRILELTPEKTRENLEMIRKNQDEELKAGLPEEKYKLMLEIQEKGPKKVKSKHKKNKKKKKDQ